MTHILYTSVLSDGNEIDRGCVGVQIPETDRNLLPKQQEDTITHSSINIFMKNDAVIRFDDGTCARFAC